MRHAARSIENAQWRSGSARHPDPNVAAVLGDPFGGQGSLAGTQQPDTSGTVPISDASAGVPDRGGVRDVRRPVTRHDFAVLVPPGPQSGSDELGGRDGVFRADQQPGGLAEEARAVVHGVHNVAAAPSGAPVGLAQVSD